MSYTKEIETLSSKIADLRTWGAIDAESAVRMRLQNRFNSGLDIARYTAGIMRQTTVKTVLQTHTHGGFGVDGAPGTQVGDF